MSQQRINVTANVLTVSFSPVARVIRTIIQVLLSIGVAIPIILNTPAVAGNAALVKDLGIVGAIIASISGVWNMLENYGISPSAGGKPATPIAADVVASNTTQLTPREVPSLY